MPFSSLSKKGCGLRGNVQCGLIKDYMYVGKTRLQEHRDTDFIVLGFGVAFRR